MLFLNIIVCHTYLYIMMITINEKNETCLFNYVNIS